VPLDVGPLGLLGSYTMKVLIHGLPGMAIVAVFVRLVQRRRVAQAVGMPVRISPASIKRSLKCLEWTSHTPA